MPRQLQVGNHYVAAALVQFRLVRLVPGGVSIDLSQQRKPQQKKVAKDMEYDLFTDVEQKSLQGDPHGAVISRETAGTKAGGEAK